MADKDKAPDSAQVDQSDPPTGPPLLADAIRSHLELKKEHGADPLEIEDERQALEDEPSLEFDWHSQRKVEQSQPDPSQDVAAESAEQTGSVSTNQAQQVATGPQPVQSPPVTSSAIQTDHDVLEDIPDFFEQTPEYDRMWFEEKAPREFDFFK